LAPPNKLGLSTVALSGLDSRLSLPLGGSGGGDSVSPYYRKDVREAERIRRLELEVSQLKSILAKQVSFDGSTVVDQSPSTQQHEPDTSQEHTLPSYLQNPETGADKEELRFFRGKEFKTRYFGPHSASLAFSEVPYPFSSLN